MLVVGRSGRRARAGGLGGSFRTPPHPRKIPPARTKRVDDRQGGVWGTGQIAGVLPPPPHTHTRTPHHTACLPRSRTFRSLAPFSLTRFSAPLPPSPPPPAASRLRRVQEDLLADYYRVHDHGFHWFLRQAYFHPDQQHHHGRKRGGGYGGCGGLSEFFCAAELNSTLQSTTRSGPAVVKLEPLIKQKNRKRPEPHSPHTPHRFLLCTYTCGLRTIRTGIPVARTACVASSKLLGTPSPANPSAAKTWSNSLREGRSVST